jgi:MGT family glycosyltransferase
MPKALFFNVPAHGHLNPSLPLVAELARRGHDVTYYCSEGYRARIEATGARFQAYRSIRDDYFEAQGLNGSVPQEAAKALLATAHEVLPELLEAASQAQPEYILYDCMCPWGYFLAQCLKLPAVSSSSLMPLSPRTLFDWKILRIFLPTIAKGFRAGNEANRLSAALGEQYGVRALNMTELLNAPGDLMISYSSAEFVPYADTLPKAVKFVGWTLPESNGGETFVHDSQRPLIYISLGTVSNDNTDFFRACIQAFTHAPYDVLLTTGGKLDPAQFGALPDNITIKSWVPQNDVLRQASLFVTHGGLNSLHEGLYCGLPLLVVPQQGEQTFNGQRVVALGAGLMLTQKQMNAAALRESAARLLNEPAFKREAQRIGDLLRAAGGAARAADEVEALVRK